MRIQLVISPHQPSRLLSQVSISFKDSKGVVKTFTSRVREQSDGTLLATFCGETHRLSAQEEPLGLRLELDGTNTLLPTMFDPSELRSDVNGKVVRFLHEDGTCSLSLSLSLPTGDAQSFKRL
jgi:hypothetical protein